MRIGMVLPNIPYPLDIRVEKEACVLTRAGHEVFLLCKGTPSQASADTVGLVRVIRHVVHPDSIVRRKVDSLTYLATMDSPSWKNAVVRFVRENDIDALHLHDLPFSRSVLIAARTCHVPFVIDLHENYPAALRLWERRLIDRVFFSPARAERLESRVVDAADRVIVVVDEARERLITADHDADKMVVFGNSEPLDLLASATPLDDFDGAAHIVYVGGVAAHRGLDTAVAAMPAILESLPDSTMTIVGDGSAFDQLASQVRQLNLNGKVRLTGRLTFAEAMEHVRAANVAMIPHLRSPHTDATVPHKLFQYMALGRAVIVSDCAPLARIVRTTGAGTVFPSGDSASMAARVISMADASTLAQMGAAGQRAVAGTWNLEVEGRALIKLYDSLQPTDPEA